VSLFKLFGEWLKRLLGGWLPLGGKPFGEWLGKLIFTAGTSLLMIMLTTNIPGCKKPAPVPPGQAIHAGGSVSNPTYTVQPRFGCASVQFKESP
jgi:hypothetical protein